MFSPLVKCPLPDTSAFHRCTKLKTVTFPSGTVYFDAEPLTSTYFYAYSNEGIFTECDAIENVTIPSGFEAAYISRGDSKEYTLADYFSGHKIQFFAVEAAAGNDDEI